MTISGSLAQTLKSKVQRLFDDKAMSGQGLILEKESETKLLLTLNAKKTENLIVGFRLRIGGS